MSGCEFPFSGPSTGQSIEQHIDSLLRAVRFLDLIKPFTPLVPEVAAPETKIPFSQKLMWTGVSQNPPARVASICYSLVRSLTQRMT